MQQGNIGSLECKLKVIKIKQEAKNGFVKLQETDILTLKQ